MNRRLLHTAARIALLFTAHLLAQAIPEPAWQQAAGTHRQFEIASLKPVLPDSPYIGNVDLVAEDSADYTGGLVRMDGPLVAYIGFAWKVTDISQAQSIYKQLGKPFENQRYALEARVEGHPSTDGLRLMVQSLLADRFHLALHTETRPGRVYLFTLDPSVHQPAPGLTPHPNDGICTPQPATRAPTPPTNSPNTASDKPALPRPPYCALLLTSQPNHLTQARVLGFSINAIAGALGTLAPYRGGMDPLPVLNRTSLPGNFDLHLTFRPAGHAPPEGQQEDPAPNFEDALQHDAGLKLTKSTGPVETYLIDHVDPPPPTKQHLTIVIPGQSRLREGAWGSSPTNHL